jgi:hypothetical protein
LVSKKPSFRRNFQQAMALIFAGPILQNPAKLRGLCPPSDIRVHLFKEPTVASMRLAQSTPQRPLAANATNVNPSPTLVCARNTALIASQPHEYYTSVPL